jgi:hypothetical protein
VIAFAGIDEAGLGPLLGPLCVGLSGFALAGTGSAPADPFEPLDLWRLLAGRVSREPRDDRRALVVGDSKLVHARHARGRRRLETTVLCFAAACAAGRVPAGLDELSFDDPAERDWLARHPWLGGAPPTLPLFAPRETLELATELLRRDLAHAGVAPLVMGVRRVEPAELNREFDRCGNKSLAVWQYTVALLHQAIAAAQRSGAAELRVVVDRQGGRARYGPLLARACPRFRVHLVEEGDGVSRYRLAGEPDVYVAFEERAETRHFATALASCLAKYAREVSMEAFNAWFAARCPGLAPTAGYTTDGRRWLADAESVVASLERDLVVRRR